MIAPTLPPKWRTVTLNDVAAPVHNAIVDGPFGSNLKLADYVPEGVPVLQGKNITDDTFRWFDVRFISSRKAEELKRSSVRIGDILVVKIGSIGYSAILDDLNGFDQAIIPANLAKVTPNLSKVDLRYLHRWLTSTAAKNYLVRAASKTAQPALSLGKIKGLPVPLPPLPEQRRIAAILDKADALRAKRRAALAQLDILTQSIFLDMFGDPATNPKGWPVKRIDEITECLDRLRRPVTVTDRKPGSVPYYGANGQQGWIDVPLFDEPLVLVAEDGGYFDAPQRGVAYRIDGPAWVNNHAHILRAIPEHVDTEFLHRSLRHYNFLPYISGTTRAKLTQGQLNSVKLFVPPPELQQDFSKRIGDVQRIARCTSASSDQLDALFACLQHRAFRGEL